MWADIQRRKVPGQILQPVDTLWFYLVEALSGQIWRNHGDLWVQVEKPTSTQSETSPRVIVTHSHSGTTTCPPERLTY